MGGSSLQVSEKNWKIVQNSPILVLIFWSSIPCIFCYTACTLLKVVTGSYYDLSVLSTSGIGFQNNWIKDERVGELYLLTSCIFALKVSCKHNIYNSEGHV